ncbi:MAG: 3-phosphoglycerate dehydrogenase [Ruminococcaceae bacterium]|nr:3-phosphoglycerate dehydrogenase [Oscillospiraceae bacterium]
MNKIQLLNKIAKVGTDRFDADKYEIAEEIANPDAIMVRSAAMHDMEFGDNLKAIARAGAGVNNIPIDKCSEKGIVVFNTPGANANGVKELAVAALLLASRDIVGGIEWVRTLKGTEAPEKAVEKGKSKFAGVEIEGKTLGIIGLGAIGGLVANVAKSLGMKVIGCDPYITVEAAWGLSRSIEKAATYDEIYAKSDYISVHVPATAETKGMLCAENFAKMKDGVRIINLSRADLLNSADLKVAIASGKVASYVTDFPTDDIINEDKIIAIPHLGASTEESEDNCAIYAANELIDYLENGNIKNSVNFPNATMPRGGDARLCIMHKNVPTILSQISGAFSDEHINIENLINHSKKELAYTMVECHGEIPAELVSKVKAIDGVIRVNVIVY